MFVLHPSGEEAREIVAGRIVDFDETGAVEVTIPHLVAHYARGGYTTFATLAEWGGLELPDDDGYASVAAQAAGVPDEATLADDPGHDFDETTPERPGDYDDDH